MIKKTGIAFLLLFLAVDAFAGGFRVSLQGVRQSALGAQGAALTGDASVMFYNPAALAFVGSQWSVAAGVFGVRLTSKYQNRTTLETAETDNPLGTPLYAALSYKPVDKLALGVSVTTPFGSTVDWGNNWSGKYVINRIALKSFFIQPTIAYQFNDWFALGGGAVIAKGSVNIQREVAVAGNDASLEIDAPHAQGWGMNLGVFIKPSEKVNLGLSYRSELKMKAEDGDVKWKNVPQLVSGSLPFNAKKFNAQLPLPAELLFGVTYQATPKWMLAAEIGAVNWGTYKELVINLTNGKEGYKNQSTKEFKNTVNYSLGAEYAATDKLDLRLGYKFDESPSPGRYFNPETPTVNYHAFTSGLGYKFKALKIDLMAEYLKGNEREFNNVDYDFGGDIVSSGFIFGLGLSYNFDLQ
ncbi:47 kDa outer membrane protein precursor [Candidatus Ornithobacterium hominis]|uniref:OmpP1/FadL family transporter n=1 Tax=Candidatus Ornithobacterium hominis TaxID=2497989 RepID=UPI000E5BB141|nr:outer membrane protein transport protein [Candidatus Ornithobacterium hominis]SZD71689.1 47 kDa outer membrane protein precursor [Candidatus Ornithobacterium hominis]